MRKSVAARCAAAAVLLLGGAVWGALGGDGRAAVETTGDAPPTEDIGETPAAEVTAAEPDVAGPQPVDGDAQAGPGADWRVVGIVDGDTIDVHTPDGAEERVRIVGIDTPERGECGFAEASTRLAGLVEGHEVVLVSGANDDRDHYGRLLRYVEVEGSDVGLALIEAGHAIARYDSRDGYGRHPREDAYVAADVAAAPFTCEASAPVPSSTYDTCTAAREAGAAPVRRGDPGYAAHLDGDDDGIGCE